jgi:hypothetical protein
MDIPDLVQRALGGEEIQAGVSLGDEDAVCFTPTRTLVYKGEGLISDEGVEEFPLDVERLGVKRSRRKTKFQLQYIEGPRSFTVPSSHGEEVLEHLLEGVFRVESVIEPDEAVVGVYLFSELTLVVTDGRLVKHIGEAVWDDDYEIYDFEDVTGLDFERTSVATSIVVEIDGYPQRVKVPSDTGPIVRKTLQDALFDFHGVGSLEKLNRALGPDDDEPETDATSDEADDLTLGSGIDPLVTDSDSDPARGVEDPFAAGSEEDETVDEGSPLAEPALDPSNDDEGTADAAATGSETADDRASTERVAADDDPLAGAAVSPAPDDGGADDEPGESDTTTTATGTTDARSGAETGTDSGQVAEASDATERSSESSGDSGEQATRESSTDESTADTGTAAAATDVTAGENPAAAADVATREEVEAVADRLEELTDAVDRQNELLKRQHRAMKQLVERLDAE